MVGGLCMGLAAIVACWLPDFVGSQRSGSDYKAADPKFLALSRGYMAGNCHGLGNHDLSRFAWLYAEAMDERALGEAGPIYVVWVACVGVTSPV